MLNLYYRVFNILNVKKEILSLSPNEDNLLDCKKCLALKKKIVI